jgi:carbamoyltransferase
MITLGITNNDLAGACLVRGNQIVSAVSEERFTRVKDDKTWPARSIRHVLDSADITLNDIDCVAYGWNAGFNAEKHLVSYFDRIVHEATHFPQGLSYFRKRIVDEIANDKGSRDQFDDFVARHELRSKVIYIDHHECHALGAYVCSPFERALVMTCDGRGDYQSLTISDYSPGQCEVLQRETTVDSLGYLYGRITRLLGYRPNRHEGKITGLAAFGDPERLLPVMREMVRYEDGRLRASCGDLYQPSYNGYSEALESLVSREKPEDVAAAVQRHCEELVTAALAHHLAKVGERDVCLAGGVFANVKLNQRVRELPGVRNVFVLPCMGDGGLALAAAVGAAYLKEGTRFPQPSMCLGPDAGDLDDHLALLESEFPDLTYSQPTQLIPFLTEALAHNQVIGIVKGRTEFGPRALCNRSIIYHAADRKANDWLNKRMHRTEFMPFAPITAEELAPQCYVGWQHDHVAAEYMTMTYDCTASFKDSCPAVVHVDGTARPQVVRRNIDPLIYELLTAWYKRTGQAALINTSFNKHEEPIVCSAQDALEGLLEGVVDIVVLNGSLVVWQGNRNEFATTRLQKRVRSEQPMFA